MTRRALVRVQRPGLGWPGQDATPAGFLGWYETRPARRFAIVADRFAFTVWVARRAPWHLVASGEGVAVTRDFESKVGRMVAATGGWREPGTEGPVELVPGVQPKTDGEARICCTTPAGAAWESPVDVTRQEVLA